MPAYVYGDSYGQVAQNELGLDAARDARYFQTLQDQRSRQSEADTVALQQQQMDQQRLQQQAALGQAFNFHQDDTAERAAQLAQQRDLFLRQLDNNRDIAGMAATERQAALGKNSSDRLYAEAYQAITNGIVRTPAHLDAITGNSLPPQDKLKLRLYLDEAHNRLVHTYNEQAQAANNLGLTYARTVGPYEQGAAAAQALIDKAPAAKDRSIWGRLTGATTKEDYATSPPAAIRMYGQELDRFNQNFAKDKRAQGMVSQDAATHQFVPIMSPPDEYAGASTQLTPLSASSHAAAAGAKGDLSSGNIPAFTEEQGPGDINTWSTFPGTNISVHPAVKEAITAKVNSLAPEPGETDTQFQARRVTALHTLTQQALQEGTAKVTAPVDQPASQYQINTLSGLDAMMH